MASSSQDQRKVVNERMFWRPLIRRVTVRWKCLMAHGTQEGHPAPVVHEELLCALELLLPWRELLLACTHAQSCSQEVTWCMYLSSEAELCVCCGTVCQGCANLPRAIEQVLLNRSTTQVDSHQDAGSQPCICLHWWHWCLLRHL